MVAGHSSEQPTLAKPQSTQRFKSGSITNRLFLAISASWREDIKATTSFSQSRKVRKGLNQASITNRLFLAVSAPWRERQQRKQ